MAFPSGLDFSLKKNAIQTALHQQVHYPITGSTANPLDLVTFSLSCGKYGQYINPTDSYISFKLVNTDAVNPLIIDGSGYSFFDRVTTLSSGSTVSDLQSFAPWAQLTLDMMVGTGRPTTMTTFAGNAYDANRNNVRGGYNLGANNYTYISLPLIGTAIDASCSDKYIPAGAISDLQLQFYIAAVNNAVQSASANASWQLQQVSLTVSYITLDAGAQRMLDEIQGGTYRWSGEMWKGYNFNLNSGSSADNVIVPFKGASVKSLAVIQRYAANQNNAAALTNTSRFCSFVAGSTWFVTVGSDTYPAIPLKNYTQHAVEFLKMIHGLSNPLALQTSFDSSTWIAGDSVSPTTCGSFVAALNTEAYSNKSGVIHSGLQVLGGTTLVLNQTYSTPLPAATLQTSFVHFDTILTVENGQLTVAF